MAETLVLFGGFHDGHTVTLAEGEPPPSRWNQVVPVPVIAYYVDTDDTAALMRSIEIDRDEYVPALDPSGHRSRNDRGEFVYRRAGGWRGGKWVEAHG